MAERQERGMNERIRKLRKLSVETQPHIYMERAVLETEAYQMHHLLSEFGGKGGESPC